MKSVFPYLFNSRLTKQNIFILKVQQSYEWLDTLMPIYRGVSRKKRTTHWSFMDRRQKTIGMVGKNHGVASFARAGKVSSQWVFPVSQRNAHILKCPFWALRCTFPEVFMKYLNNRCLFWHIQRLFVLTGKYGLSAGNLWITTWKVLLSATIDT